MSYPIVRPLLPRDVEPLQKAAAEDRHLLIYPTHLITRENKIVGYFSIKPPYVNVWISTQEITARDTLHLCGVLDALLAQAGCVDYILITSLDSPVTPFLEKLGYISQYQSILAIKKLFHPQPPS